MNKKQLVVVAPAVVVIVVVKKNSLLPNCVWCYSQTELRTGRRNRVIPRRRFSEVQPC